MQKAYRLQQKNADIAAIPMFKCKILVFLASAALFSGCATTSQLDAKKHPKKESTPLTYDAKNYRVDTKTKPQVGNASYYAKCFHGRRTSSGEMCDTRLYTAAHRTWPFGTIVRVTMVKTGKSVLVKINDRGPHTKSRVIDLSVAAAKQLGLIGPGVAKVKVEKLVKIH